MIENFKSIVRSCMILVVEMLIFYGAAFGIIYLVDPSDAMFLAELSTVLALCACGVGRTAVPHTLLRYFRQPPILIAYTVVVIFSVGKTPPDLTVFAPSFALALIAAALGERINRLLRKKRGTGR